MDLTQPLPFCPKEVRGPLTGTKEAGRIVPSSALPGPSGLAPSLGACDPKGRQPPRARVRRVASSALQAPCSASARPMDALAPTPSSRSAERG